MVRDWTGNGDVIPRSERAATISSARAHDAEMVASVITLTRRAALGLALLPALRRPAVAADLKDIVSTPSGLRYVDFAPGSGAPPRFGQLVRFHYVGYIASEDGESLEGLPQRLGYATGAPVLRIDP